MKRNKAAIENESVGQQTDDTKANKIETPHATQNEKDDDADIVIVDDEAGLFYAEHLSQNYSQSRTK